MAGTATGIITNLYIVPYQLTHLKAIHVGIAILYFVGFGLVCWNVKEGEYPPPEDVDEKTKFSDQVKLYFRECFVHPIFILFYLSTACMVLTKGLNPAGVFGLHLSEHKSMVDAYPDAERPAAEPPDKKKAVPLKKAHLLEMAMAMTPDGKFLATAGKDGKVEFWDDSGKKPKMLRTAGTNDGAGLAVALTRDGKTAVTGSLGGAIEWWDTARAKCVRRVEAPPRGRPQPCLVAGRHPAGLGRRRQDGQDLEHG